MLLEFDFDRACLLISLLFPFHIPSPIFITTICVDAPVAPSKKGKAGKGKTTPSVSADELSTAVALDNKTGGKAKKASEARAHKEQLERLKTQQAEFYEFLKNNDKVDGCEQL